MKFPIEKRMVLFAFLGFLTVANLIASCSQTSPPVIGHSTALKENLPVYEPFASGPLQDLGNGSLSPVETPADFLFEPSVTTVRMEISPSEWKALITDSKESRKNKHLARVIVGDSIVDNVNLSFMGRGSLKIPQDEDQVLRSNFMLEFEDNLYGLPALILKANDRDETYMRPFLVAEMMREFGVPTPRIGFVALHLEITGRESLYLGVYALHEFIDESWITRQLGEMNCIFDVGKGDNGYGYLDASKDYWIYPNSISPCDQGSTGIPILNESDPRWRGQTFQPAYSWVGGNQNCEKCESTLNLLILSLLKSDSRELIADFVDIEAMLRYMTISAFVSNVDDFWIYGNNVFLCHAEGGPRGTWLPVPFDFDLTFNQEFDDLRNPGGTVLNYGIGSILGERILNHEEFRRLYRNLVWTWCRSLESHSIEQRVSETVTIFQDHLRGYDVEDPYPFSENAVQELIRFSNEKLAKARQELKPISE